MAENPRIEDLRRRIQKDPASIAFAQLAEELRRAGQYQESVDVCRAGLDLHAGYLSARVTLGRALIELDQLDEAESELTHVLRSAPENLAALRGLADIYHRSGRLADALKQYRAALALAPNDPELEQTVDALAREVEPRKPAPVVVDGLSLDEMQSEMLKIAPPPGPARAKEAVEPVAEADTPEPTAAIEAADPPDAILSTPQSTLPDGPAPHEGAEEPDAANGEARISEPEPDTLPASPSESEAPVALTAESPEVDPPEVETPPAEAEVAVTVASSEAVDLDTTVTSEDMAGANPLIARPVPSPPSDTAPPEPPVAVQSVEPPELPADPVVTESVEEETSEARRRDRTVAALERFLDAIDTARTGARA